MYGGRGRPWYGTSAQPESHFTCSSPRGAPRVVPSTSLLNYFWGILSGSGEGQGGAPGTVPLQNPEVTSRKACLRNADCSWSGVSERKERTWAIAVQRGSYTIRTQKMAYEIPGEFSMPSDGITYSKLLLPEMFYAIPWARPGYLTNSRLPYILLGASNWQVILVRNSCDFPRLTAPIFLTYIAVMPASAR